MTFDPRPYQIMLPGRKDKNGVRGPAMPYLQVKHRVRWLRDEHADADIESHVISIDDTRAIMQVRVSLPSGGAATATGTELKAVFPDYIEKAETVALGRALAILGYGIDFSDDFDEDRQEAEPRDYKSIEPPQDEKKPHAKAAGWPENAKPAPAEPAPVLKQGEKAVIPPKRLTNEQETALTQLAIQKNIDLVARCKADFNRLPGELNYLQAGQLITKISKETH